MNTQPIGQMSVHDTLVRARALIENPLDWDVGFLESKPPSGPRAGHTCRCLLGAIGAASGIPLKSEPEHNPYDALRWNHAVVAVAREAQHWSWPDELEVSLNDKDRNLKLLYLFNDNNQHAEVLDLLDRVIAQSAP